MRLVAGHWNTTDMVVGVDLVEAEPQWMIRTSKEHFFFCQFYRSSLWEY